MDTPTLAPEYARRVTATLELPYDIIFRRGLLDQRRPDLAQAGTHPGDSGRRFVIVDSEVQGKYGATIDAYYAQYGIEIEKYVIGAGPEMTVLEEIKSIETVLDIISAILKFGPVRRDPITVFGGGVLMDIVGVVASLLKRGFVWVRVPTTLIGIVDAGVGGKTGVNFEGGKNAIGTIWPAQVTIIDVTFLATLTPRHVANGLAEIYKIGHSKDAYLHSLLERYGELLLSGQFQTETIIGQDEDGHDLTVELVVLQRAIDGMVDELEPDLWEKILRRLMDDGHTIGPKLEMAALPHMLHGESVAIDMALFSVVAWLRGKITHSELRRMLETLRKLNLPTWHHLLTRDIITAALRANIAHRNGHQHIPIPVGIGVMDFLEDVTADEVVRAADWLAVHGFASPYWSQAAVA